MDGSMTPREIMIPAWIDGRLTPVEKLAAHERGLRHLAVSVFVLRAGRILIQQRALGKYHTPGLWANTCCTHPAWGEEPRATATRRLPARLGLSLLRRCQLRLLPRAAEAAPRADLRDAPSP